MAGPILNRPLWLDGADTSYPALSGDVEVDVAVLGAGITGVTAAHLLKREGCTVALVELNRIGFGATGYTTAKLTVGHNLVYADLVESFGQEAAQLYARSNQEAIERVASLVDEHGIDCDFERTANYVYVESPERAGDIHREAEAARAAGVQAEVTTETELPYEVAAALRVDGQAQFHPWKYLAGLARLLPGEGSYVFERTCASAVRREGSCVVETSLGRIRAGHVIVATQLPFLDRGLFFAKAHPTVSYAIAAAVDHAPRGMYISAEQPARSVRSTPGAESGGRLLIVGGEGHKPGAEPDTRSRYRTLESFMHDRFGVGPPDYHWSTHDYAPLDGLPYIGRLRRGDERILTATGFAKWGMTKGTLAAAMLTDAVLRRPNEYAELYEASRVDLRRSAPRLVKENATVGARFVGDRLRRRRGREAAERLEPGEGTIVRVGAAHYAVSRSNAGELVVLSARCTHLGCIVGWNSADRAWECPCHGSRFAADGSVVQGPATRSLPPARW